jgi:hypothetical protein
LAPWRFENFGLGLDLEYIDWHGFLCDLRLIFRTLALVVAQKKGYWFHLFEGLWRYVSMRDMRNGG